MKKIYFLLLFLVFLSACSLGVYDNNKKEEVVNLKNNLITESKNNEEKYICGINGLIFNYPKNWNSCRINNNKIYFRTDFEKWEVDLVGEVYQVQPDEHYNEYEEYLNIFKDQKNKDLFEFTDRSVIYKDACGGAVACYVLKIEDRIYLINWTIESDQAPELEYDGVWSPDEHNIEPEDVSTVMKSISLKN